MNRVRCDIGQRDCNPNLWGIVLAVFIGLLASGIRAEPPAAGDLREVDEFVIPADAGIVNVKTDFGARSSWGGGGEGDGYKLPALAFIPPKAGKYKVQGTVAVEFWSGGGTVKLVLLTRDAKKKEVTEVKALSFSNDAEGLKPQELADTEVTLAEGQELIITAVMANGNTGVTYNVTKFRIVSPD